MGLVINHISASHHFADAKGRSAIGVSGSMFFQPKAVADVTSTETNAAMRAVAHDAAYIFSGSAGGEDKTVFLGDVVVSGSLSLGGGGTFLEGTLTSNRIPFAQDQDTLIDDEDLVYNQAANTVVIGKDATDAGALNLGSLSTPDFTLFNDGKGDIGLQTATGYKLAVTGARTPAAGVIGVEIGSDAGVVLGQGGGSHGQMANGFIFVRALGAEGDVQDSQGGIAAVMVKSDVGGLLLSGSKQAKLFAGGNATVETEGQLGLVATGSVELRAGASSNLKMATNVASKQTLAIVASNADGSNVADIDVDADGKLLLDGATGIDIGVNADVAVDFNAARFDLDASGLLTIDSSGGNINIGAEAHTNAINIGTGASARTITVGNDASTKVDVDALAIELDAVNTVLVDGGKNAGDAIKLNASNAAGGFQLFGGSGGFDLDVSSAGDGSGDGAVTIDAGAGISLDAAAASNFTTSGGAITINGNQGVDIQENSISIIKIDDDQDVAIGVSGKNVQILGNLQVEGTTTAVSSSNTTFQDSIIGLGVSGSEDFNNVGDRGIVFARGAAAGAALPALRYDGTNAKFELGTYLTSPKSASFSAAASYLPLKLGALELAGGLSLPDSAGNNSLTLEANGDDLSADRTLDFIVADSGGTDADRTLHIEASTVKLDQDYTVDATVQFARVRFDTANDFIDVNASGDVIVNSAQSITASSTSGIHLDAADVVMLDSNIFDFSFAQGGTERLVIETDGSDHVAFTSDQDDKDMIFVVKDGGVETEVVRVVSATPGLTLKDDTPVNLGDTTAALKRNGGAGKAILQAGAAAADALVLQATAGSNAGGIDIESGTHLDLTTAAGKATVTATNNTSDDAILLDAQAGGIKAACAKSITLESIENQSDSIQITAKHDDGGIDLSVGATPAVVMSIDADSIDISQKLVPTADNSLDLGSSSARFANIYTGDLNLRNDRGDWTLIEEEDFISFRNNRTGRRFRMVMEDITGTGTYGPGNDGEM